MSGATTVPAPGETLRCGTPVDRLIEQAQAGRAADLTAHERSCPLCRDALAHYDRVFASLRRLAAEPVRAPRTAADEALARLRGRRGADREPWRVDAGRGQTRVGERVVVACARRAAEGLPGVRVALARAGVDDGDGGVVLEVVVAAAYGVDLPALGERVRRAVAGEVANRTGVPVTSVSAVIDTVVES